TEKLMKTLFEITQEVIELASLLEDGEFTPELEQQLAITREELDSKAENYVKVIRSVEGDISVIDAEIKRLKEIRDGKSRVVDRMKVALSTAMTVFKVDNIETALMKLFFRKSESVEVLDESLVPEQYKLSSVVVNPDKILIKKIIKSGEDVPGCEIVEKFNLQIK